MNERGFELSPVFCLHNGAVLLNRNKNAITFGLLDSSNTRIRRRLENAANIEKINHGKVNFIPLSSEEFNRHISEIFSKNDDCSEQKKEEEKNRAENEAAALLDALIGNACSSGATDIHIEENLVRFRVKGVLQKEIELSGERKQALVRRIKLLAGMNVVEQRIGQDGHFVHSDENARRIFVRVSSIPVVGSKSCEEESVVLRLLDSTRVPLEIESLGFTKSQQEDLKALCTLKNGLVLICGPTGSGKSTTAGALLEEIRKKFSEGKKIVSLEDPPEYVLDGVSQVKIESAHGMDFSNVLKSVFRQDPDVIFIGEIRDEESAKIAVQASLTGHLVFATLHTSSVSKAVLRLNDLGANPKLVAEVLRAVVIQNLNEGVLDADVRIIPEVVCE